MLKFSEGDAAYNSINFGDVVQSGLTRGQFVADMKIDGTLTPNGSGADLISTNGLQIDWQRGNIHPGNGPVQILYDPSNGNLSVNSPARSVTTFEVKSDSGLFLPENLSPGVLNPPFNLISPSKLFKLSAGAGAYN